MPSMTTVSSVTVDPFGLVNVGNLSDGSHLVFVDNTPGMNGNIVIIGVGDNGATFYVYVSKDQGMTWMRHTITPTAASAINNMGACQDTVSHAFHVTWLDANDADEYARLVPTYVGGDITGFTVPATYVFFNAGTDSPGPRDLAEVVDGAGNHRIAFVGTEGAAGTFGLFKFAISSVTTGVAPASQSDWVAATTPSSQEDPLLPNNFSTGDAPTSYMASIASNLAGGSSAPIVVVAGLPVDRKLLAWILKPTANGTFMISATQTLMGSGFGGGDGSRSHSSLSVSSAPSGDTWILYSADTSSQVPGLHVTKVDKSGNITLDAAPQPTKDPGVRHGVIATDSASTASVIYYDGASITGTLLWNGAWLSAVPIATAIQPTAAWSISNPWQPPMHAFGYFASSGATNPMTFSSIVWK